MPFYLFSLLIFLFFSPFISSAQDDEKIDQVQLSPIQDSSKVQHLLKSQFNKELISSSIKWSFGDLMLLRKPSIQVGYEHKIISGVYLNAELGYIFLYDPSFEIQSRQGFRVKGGLRYYPNDLLFGGHSAFVDVSLAYRLINEVRGAELINLEHSLYQLMEYDYVRKSLTLCILGGGVVSWSKSRFLFEYSAGLGLRALRVMPYELPEGYMLPSNGNSFLNFHELRPRDAPRYWPTMHLNLKLSYILS